MISVRVKKRLGTFQLNAAFEGGSGVTVLFGASGAGKSSILSAVAGVLRPDSGHVRLGPDLLFDKDKGVDVPLERRRVGWVFQDGRLFPHLSVEGNLRFGQKRARGVPQPIAFDQVVEMLGIEGLLDRRLQTLSGGEAQRVAIGRALLSQPQLLLMDEPLASLDDFRKAEILAFIERATNAFAIPILYVTHSRDEALRLAERIVVVQDGEVVVSGPPRDVMALMGDPLV
jgi:molybdate transport system ATP-binding protein